MRIESASRLKNKILDEVKQLPEDGYHNIIILDISHHLTNFEDAESAIAWQIKIRLNKETLEATPFREANGIIYMDEGKNIGVLIAFKGFEYENRRKYVNSLAKCPFTDDLLSQI